MRRRRASRPALTAAATAALTYMPSSRSLPLCVVGDPGVAVAAVGDGDGAGESGEGLGALVDGRAGGLVDGSSDGDRDGAAGAGGDAGAAGGGGAGGTVGVGGVAALGSSSVQPGLIRLGEVKASPSVCGRLTLRAKISGQRLPSPSVRSAIRHKLSWMPSRGGCTSGGRWRCGRRRGRRHHVDRCREAASGGQGGGRVRRAGW